jgi:hypothetical protein
LLKVTPHLPDNPSGDFFCIFLEDKDGDDNRDPRELPEEEEDNEIDVI